METAKKDFDTVKFAREIKDKMDAKLSKMTKEEIIAYFEKKRLEDGGVRPRG